MAQQSGTGCSSRDPDFGSQHPHSGAQLPITQVLGVLTPSLDSVALQVMHIQTGRCTRVCVLVRVCVSVHVCEFVHSSVRV